MTPWLVTARSGWASEVLSKVCQIEINVHHPVELKKCWIFARLFVPWPRSRSFPCRELGHKREEGTTFSSNSKYDQNVLIVFTLHSSISTGLVLLFCHACATEDPLHNLHVLCRAPPAAGLTDSGEVGVLFASSPPSEGDGATSLSEIRRRNQEHDEESKQGPPSWRDDGRSLIAAEGDGQIVRLTRANEAMERVSSSLAKVEWRALEAHLTNKGDKRRSTVITIHNATGSRMVLCRSHDIHGSPVDPFPTIIDSGSWEVVLHTKAPWSLYGSEGYVVYKAENADGETYEVSLGFMTSYQTIRCAETKYAGLTGDKTPRTSC